MRISFFFFFLESRGGSEKGSWHFYEDRLRAIEFLLVRRIKTFRMIIHVSREKSFGVSGCALIRRRKRYKKNRRRKKK